jgi:hypothetical protein
MVGAWKEKMDQNEWWQKIDKLTMGNDKGHLVFKTFVPGEMDGIGCWKPCTSKILEKKLSLQLDL